MKGPYFLPTYNKNVSKTLLFEQLKMMTKKVVPVFTGFLCSLRYFRTERRSRVSKGMIFSAKLKTQNSVYAFWKKIPCRLFTYSVLKPLLLLAKRACIPIQKSFWTQMKMQKCWPNFQAKIIERFPRKSKQTHTRKYLKFTKK